MSLESVFSIRLGKFLVSREVALSLGQRTKMSRSPMSAVVVAGGVSKRFGQDKGLIRLARKPLILHVLDKLTTIVDDVVVVVNSEDQRRKFVEEIERPFRILIDRAQVRTPLAGALAGFETIQNEYTLLLACDTPFLSSDILNLLLELCANRTAAVPRWPNGNIEPLQAAYQVKRATKAAKAALEEGELDMRSMIGNLQNVRYISTIVLQQLDPKLRTFFNINTLNDLKEAQTILEQNTF